MENNQTKLKDIYGFKVKSMKDLKIDTTSTDPNDFIEVLNAISPEFGGVTNLGVFCDITNVEQSSAIRSEVEEQFVHVETERAEKPYALLDNDGSSTEPYDFDFEKLLND